MIRSRKVRINRPQRNSLAIKNTIKHLQEGSCLCYYFYSECRRFDPILMIHHFPFLCWDVADTLQIFLKQKQKQKPKTKKPHSKLYSYLSLIPAMSRKWFSVLINEIKCSFHICLSFLYKYALLEWEILKYIIT